MSHFDRGFKFHCLFSLEYIRFVRSVFGMSEVVFTSVSLNIEENILWQDLFFVFKAQYIINYKLNRV
jgi:hypothetical protein